MRQGIFITFEGPDGSGKSTQITYLKQYLQEKGLPCIFTREPGGTRIGEKLREIILNRENDDMCDMTEVLLYAASRAQHVEQVIRPALEQGNIVVCDRFVDSSIAYQGYGRGLENAVRTVNELAIDGCMPDMTFLMVLSPEIGKARILSENQDRLEQEKIEFHQKVFAGYRELAVQNPARFVEVNAGRDREEIRKKVISHVESILEG